MGFVKGIVGADHRGITYEPTPLGGTTVTSCAAADRSRANAFSTFSAPSDQGRREGARQGASAGRGGGRLLCGMQNR